MLPYYSFTQYLKKYPFPVYKATIDAGFICPNMDGTKSIGGCTFCNNASFSPAFRLRKEEITIQLEKNIARFKLSRKKIAKKKPQFIAYFQAFSGTYGSIELMKSWWYEALKHPEVIGISISTRADCLSSEVLDLLTKLSEEHSEVWLEIGVESTHDQTLHAVNRGHTYAEVVDAVKLIQKIPTLKLCLHLIHGLPLETPAMMVESVKKLSLLKPTAIKFHHLEIVKDTALAKQHETSPIKLLSMEDYFAVLGQSIAVLSPDIIVQRLFSQSPKEFLIAPLWQQEKQQHQIFLKYLETLGITQGCNL